MDNFAAVIEDIFARRAERRLSVDEEREALRASRLGDEAATIALLYAYAPALRKAASHYAEALGAEDARSTAILGLLTAVAEFDEDTYDRLAATIVQTLANQFVEALADQAPVTVPSRTRTRFFGILRRAEGNVHAAALLAPSFEMSRETFYAVWEALRVQSVDDRQDDDRAEFTGNGLEGKFRPLWGEEALLEDATDRILVELAFSAVDDLETDICRMRYGFASYEPMSDGEIGDHLGLQKRTVQRRRSGALDKMRSALGA